jgi:hypothetical protein
MLLIVMELYAVVTVGNTSKRVITSGLFTLVGPIVIVLGLPSVKFAFVYDGPNDASVDDADPTRFTTVEGIIFKPESVRI